MEPEKARMSPFTTLLCAGEYVLDVGHGIGGGDFYMAREYGVRVQGIDLSCNMTQLARERSKNEENAKLDVHFDICDVTTVCGCDVSKRPLARAMCNLAFLQL